MHFSESRQIEVAGNQFTLNIIRSIRRKRSLALRVDSKTTLSVYAPVRYAIKRIENFVQEQASWIMSKFSELHPQSGNSTYQFKSGETFYFKGEQVFLNLIPPTPPDLGVKLVDNQLNVMFPEITDEIIRKKVLYQQIVQWYCLEALKLTRERLQFWSEQLNLTYKKLTISNTKTRWGSCNTSGDIRINWRLIMMPVSLLDYVVAHELCHLVHMNHSKKFWSLLNSVMPDYKERRKALRQFNKELLI